MTLALITIETALKDGVDDEAIIQEMLSQGADNEKLIIRMLTMDVIHLIKKSNEKDTGSSY